MSLTCLQLPAKPRLATKPLPLLAWKLLRWMADPAAKGERTYSFVNFHPAFDIGAQLTVSAMRSAFILQAHGWTSEPDKFGNIGLSPAGYRAAKEEQQPAWKMPAPPFIYDRDIDVLAALASQPMQWMSASHCGGSSISHHIQSLAKLSAHSLATCRNANGEPDTLGAPFECEPSLFRKPRGSRTYKISSQGQFELAARRPEKIAA